MLSKITDNIYKLVVKFPQGMGDVNSYLIKGENGYTVIDTGTNHQNAIDIWQRVIDSGIMVEKVVLTHTHEDHIGLARWFKETIGVPIIVSKFGLSEMEKRRNMPLKQFNQLITKYDGPALPKNYKDDTSIYEFMPDELFDSQQDILIGEDIYQTIWTPGHAYDQYCFYNKKKNIMIVGDHILKDFSPVIGLWNGEETNPLKEYFDSLEKIKQYKPSIALPGHGESIVDLQTRVEEIQERHQFRLEQVIGAIKQEYKTASQISHEIYNTLNVIINLSAFMATVTRLIYLESLGKIERKVVNGKHMFRAI
ncbi:MBL fold metallo-hydrolase [Oceanobacillus halophilus]|uniref:MBL fold metallo-hydrolase n=1 Tax=Oceanobacillus halophilus TaxID=930130 RepID=A0A495A488_9BACI|nr:MBL fold metallo-hydrolase [Oceanobacillus halophilus]RKQ33880.1 MBL fold metallo-hydrolase [Oceanobacillus halophilus]